MNISNLNETLIESINFNNLSYDDIFLFAKLLDINDLTIILYEKCKNEEIRSLETTVSNADNDVEGKMFVNIEYNNYNSLPDNIPDMTGSLIL